MTKNDGAKRASVTMAIDEAAIKAAGFGFRINGTDAIFTRKEWGSEVRVETDGTSLIFIPEACGNARAILAALGIAM